MKTGLRTQRQTRNETAYIQGLRRPHGRLDRATRARESAEGGRRHLIHNLYQDLYPSTHNLKREKLPFSKHASVFAFCMYF